MRGVGAGRERSNEEARGHKRVASEPTDPLRPCVFALKPTAYSPRYALRTLSMRQTALASPSVSTRPLFST